MTVGSVVTTAPAPRNGTHAPNNVRQQIMFFEIVCLSIISLVGIIANMAIINKLMQQKRKSSQYFILNLVMTDIVVCSLCIPLDISVVVESTNYESKSKSKSSTSKSKSKSKSGAKFQVQLFRVRVLNISSPSPSPK